MKIILTVPNKSTHANRPGLVVINGSHDSNLGLIFNFKAFLEKTIFFFFLKMSGPIKLEPN
jgi:hypothetical protein